MGLTSKIVGVAVGILMIGVLVPIGIGEIAGANTTSWDASVVTVFTVVLPILAVIGLALFLIPRN